MKRMHKNKSVMKHTFSQVPKATIPRSSFDRSHGHKTTFDAGYLIPILVDEALPGDTFNVSMTGFARMATPIFPIMDNMAMDTQFFAVPYRLVWDNWNKFNGEQKNPDDSTDFLVPQIFPSSLGHLEDSIYDHMGIPPGVPGTGGFSHSALFLRAYNLIWNEWYRDQNLQVSVPVPTDDGPDDQSQYILLKRGKRHDYFTSALPWPQKGPGVNIPLGGLAPVRSDTLPGAPSAPLTILGPDALKHGMTVFGAPATLRMDAATFPLPSDGELYADLSLATAATINSLRQAFQIQKIFERDARGGSRYTEIVRSHFGVTSPDSRLQRPEFLGGGSSPVNISPIPQTSDTTATSPQGNLAAMGVALLQNHGFTTSFTEHCIIIGLVSVRADLTYQQGLNRMWSRKTRFDFYWPALSHIGEQAILRKEIYATNVEADNNLVFGYQERYAEYRYKPSEICSLFRSTHPLPLDAWHLSQRFSTPPVLSPEFIEENPPVDRVIAVTDQPHFLFDSFFRMQCARPMPLYGVPGLMDHF